MKRELQAMNGQPLLADRYQAVQQRIAAAARAAGREPASVQLLAVSKTFPAEAVAALAACGQRAFGENYLQEAVDKQQAVATLLAAANPPRPALEWHFIGPIQSNKTRRIAAAFAWVHSVESLRIARRLSEQRPDPAPALNVLLQVNVSGEASKSGCAPTEAAGIAAAIACLPQLRLRGLMTIPEPDPDQARVAARFAALRRLQAVVADAVGAAAGPAAARAIDTLSMGMSADLDSAIAEGSTMVRIGSAIFGTRSPKAGHEPAGPAVL